MYIFICSAFVISVLLIPIIIFLCKKHGWYDSLSERKIHTEKIPRLGGAGFVTAFVVSSVLYFYFECNLSILSLIPFIVSSLLIFIFGVIDDFKDLSAKFKLLVQIIAALIMILNGYHFTNLGSFQFGPFGYIITFVWFIGVINAFNLIDGVDALCGGLSSFILITLGVIYMRAGRSETAALCFILTAAVCGFLVYNKPKAKIFMGDGGSQFLGFMVAALPLFPASPAVEHNKMLIAGLLVSIPVLDTIAAVWRRKREHVPFFTPDRRHLHHKLMNMGYTPVSILVLLYAIQIGICCIVLIALWCKGLRETFILIGGYCIMFVFFAIIHYTHRAVTRKKNEHEDTP
ncbi:MraY family glycosyltransferase [Treponema brennaborense]|uniref:Glycosyl transferase, family 4, conserved region-containing protein n=1 Tax=Treponema brennaborense (strain DSM 12168 / CIP 105900 / DD5/3) TaxID=906968 RepID=F4LJL6_TREBD|nr:MraY family glycosyltransferase [Treponema brennaborense]AEE16411.1 Glycosyl transferase, family 4, conserved region-containing protein [Treponema brennaborense DSM 12168]